jgi:predicted patatin/cPLA2 family phospholipase
MSCTVVKGSAFADFVNVRTDESISIAVSFLKNRYHTKQVLCSTDPVFEETFLFEFIGENDQIKFDAATLLKLSQPIHITILKHRKNEKPVVIGTKSVEWRSLLFYNHMEVNSEVLPVSKT